VWREFVGGRYVVDTAGKPVAGSWSTVTQISTSGGYSPRIAVDADGDAVAVWGATKSLSEEEVQSASRPAGEQWGDAVGVSRAQCEEPTEARVAMEGDGTAVAAWYCSRRSALGVMESASMPLGGDWSSPEEISEHNLLGQLHLGADSDGAVAVWHAYFEQVEAATLAPVHQLSVTVGGSGSGAVESSPVGIQCGDECQEGLVEGTPIKLSGTPSPTSEPVVWTHCPGTVNSSDECEVTMGGTDEEALAIFDEKPAVKSQLPPTQPSQPALKPSPPTLLYSPNHPHAPNRSGGRRYTFAFTGADPAVTFLCSIDRGKFKACSSPAVYRGLKPGKHNFRVKSVDPSGQQSTALSVQFRVAGPPR
jgi:hypothetical protein